MRKKNYYSNYYYYSKAVHLYDNITSMERDSKIALELCYFIIALKKQYDKVCKFVSLIKYKV